MTRDEMTDVRKQQGRPVLTEGEGGLFTQSWFPVALAGEVPAGAVVGRNFLDGKVVVFRAPDGTPRVMGAYCPHVGADLSLGRIVDGRLQCVFHRWEYDASGQCVKTGIGDAPPKAACLYGFPAQERFGFIWAFNGETPLFDLPTLPYPDEQLVTNCYRLDHPLHCDPWVFAANTPDMQHLKVVHKMQFEVDDPHKLVRWHEFGMEFDYMATHQGGVPMKNTAGILGTSVFYRWGQYGKYWRAGITGIGLVRPGMHEVYSFQAVLAGPDAKENLQDVVSVSRRTVGEDNDILNTVHYRQGTLTAGDLTLARFFNYLRRYPRAHPSAPFIN
ncbi:MAG: Rieske 2Fe-2S domain-containing protein [Candidatus Eiseniibacteriota bacterium]